MATLELIEAARLLPFDPANGWPETFTPHLAARLQTWRKGMERKEHREEASTWTKLIELVMANGEIEHTTTIEVVPSQDSLFQRIPFPGTARVSIRPGFYYADGKARLRTAPREVTHYHIAAHAFAAWLAGRGVEPSPHAAAWFKAQNVDGACAAAETTAQRNARWLKVWDEVSPEHAPGSQAQAVQSIANAEGMKPDTVRAALQKAKKVRADLYRNGGVTPIKPGKNSASHPFGQLVSKQRAQR